MSDIFDYIRGQGCLSFAESGFNSLDALIFSRLVYLPFEIAADFSGNASFPLAEIAGRFNCLPQATGKEYGYANDVKLISAASVCNRYKNVRLSCYDNKLDSKQAKQFAAVTFIFENEPAFVAFRGTDGTLIGWEENFAMAFKTPVPAQKEAVSYLAKIAGMTNCALRLGGHSKGGNLAVYAAVFCGQSIAERIAAVFNFDGPGFDFDAEIPSSKEYDFIRPKVQTFVPQSSIVGMLLDHDTRYTIISSNQPVSILQHDVYSWETSQNDFAQIAGLGKRRTSGSKLIESILTRWIRSLNASQREEFIAVICALLNATGMKTFLDIVNNLPACTALISLTWLLLDTGTKRRFWATCRMLFAACNEALLKASLEEPEKGIGDVMQEWLEANNVAGGKALAEKAQREIARIAGGK